METSRQYFHRQTSYNLNNSQHIPYRDSKLTRILSNAIGGNSLTAIICTISPALMNYQQTLSTLRFANRAKQVKNTPMVNRVIIFYFGQKLKNYYLYVIDY